MQAAMRVWSTPMGSICRITKRYSLPKGAFALSVEVDARSLMLTTTMPGSGRCVQRAWTLERPHDFPFGVVAVDDAIDDYFPLA